MYCIHCGATNADTSKFCMQCGQTLVAPESPPATPSTQRGSTPVERTSPLRPASRRRRWLPWVVGLTLLLALSLGGVVLARTWLHLGTNDAIKLLPTDSPMTFSISPNLLQLRHLQKLELVGGAFGAVAGTAVTLPTDLLGAQLDIDFEKDVMSWAGLEFAASVVDTGQEEAGLLVAAAVRNSGAATEFTDRVRGQLEAGGKTFEEENYHDIQIVYQTPDYSGAGLAYAQYNGFLVAGTSLDALHRSVDVAQGRAPALSKDAIYQRTLGQLPGNRAGYFYLDWVALNRKLDAPSGPPVDQQIRGIGAALSLQSNGIRLDYSLVLDTKNLSPTQLAALQPSASRNRAVAAAPDNTLFIASGSRLRGLFDQFVAFRPSDDEGLNQAIQDIEDQLGINLERDLFTWADGEYALAFVEDSSGLMGDQTYQLGIALLIEANDRRAAELTMNRLAASLGDLSGRQVVDETIVGSNFHVLADPYSDTSLGYGLVGDFVVMGSSRQVLNSLASASGSPLAQNTVFKEASAPLPERNSGYIYLDVAGLVNMYYRQMSDSDKRDFDRDVRPYIGAIRAITMTAKPAKGTDDTLHGSLFVLLDESTFK